MNLQTKQEMKFERITCPRHGLNHAIRFDDDLTCEACFCEYHAQSWEPIGFETAEGMEQFTVQDGVLYSH